ncbi:hypothetical protein N7539_004673 [Penicillium diatomitis]|uniref:Uncharacterized protein n=1 Tax=Penicillium diatomitis TaxID=2819901 RepID=A0A9W9XEX4_9EURO|nr:uncharacterized protein N7539_004673 [Penicillium diatomitis]KAJ5489783.1 hypothetical protein N7539_004673 [Penicillium diatomitis]
MSKPDSGKGNTSARQQARVERILQNRLYTSLGITDATVQASINALLREIYDAGVGDLRSSVRRELVRQEIRDRMDRMPDAIQNHTLARQAVVENLYQIFKSLQSRWHKERTSTANDKTLDSTTITKEPTIKQSTTQQPTTKKPIPKRSSATQQTQTQEPAAPTTPNELFDYLRPAVVPDADVQIIVHDRPAQPLPIRLSDLMQNANDPVNRSRNGDWINALSLRLGNLRQGLASEGFVDEGSALWWSPHALETLDPTTLATPQDGETRLSSLNLVSTLIRTITLFYPQYRTPAPQDSQSSALARPSFTIIVRPQEVNGGVLGLQQPGVARLGSLERVTKIIKSTSKVPSSRWTPYPSRAPDTKTVDRLDTGRKSGLQPRSSLFCKAPPSGLNTAPGNKAPPAFKSSLFSAKTANPPQSRKIPPAIKSSLFPFPIASSPSGNKVPPPFKSSLFSSRTPDISKQAHQTQTSIPRPDARVQNPFKSSAWNPKVPQSTTKVSNAPATQGPTSILPGPSGMNLKSLEPTNSLNDTQQLHNALATPRYQTTVSPPRPLQSSIDVTRKRAVAHEQQNQVNNGEQSTALQRMPEATVSNCFTDQERPLGITANVFGNATQERSRRLFLSREDVFGPIGRAWVGVPEQQMPPVVQREIASRRVSAEITQGTERLVLAGLPDSAPKIPRPPVVIPKQLKVPITDDQRIRTRRERRRRFSEYRSRADRSSSPDSQDSPRKKRRLTSDAASSGSSPSLARKAPRGVRSLPNSGERTTTLEIGRVTADLSRLSTEPPPSPKTKRRLSSCNAN